MSSGAKRKILVPNEIQLQFVAKSLGFLRRKISLLKVLMRTLLVTKIIPSLIVVNSDKLEFLTKALILIWPLALLFFFFLFHFSLSLTLSLTAQCHSQHPNAIHNIQMIPTPNRFATISPNRSPLSHLLATKSFVVVAKSFAFTVVAFARRRR